MCFDHFVFVRTVCFVTPYEKSLHLCNQFGMDACALTVCCIQCVAAYQWECMANIVNREVMYKCDCVVVVYPLYASYAWFLLMTCKIAYNWHDEVAIYLRLNRSSANVTQLWFVLEQFEWVYDNIYILFHSLLSSYLDDIYPGRLTNSSAIWYLHFISSISLSLWKSWAEHTFCSCVLRVCLCLFSCVFYHSVFFYFFFRFVAFCRYIGIASMSSSSSTLRNEHIYIGFMGDEQFRSMHTLNAVHITSFWPHVYIHTHTHITSMLQFFCMLRLQFVCISI